MRDDITLDNMALSSISVVMGTPTISRCVNVSLIALVAGAVCTDYDHSIDIDGNDYWVWKAIDHEVMVVVIEYNCNFGYGQQCVLEYDPCNRWDNTMCYGASLSALESLGAKKGYYLYQECNFSNLIFVNNRFKSILPPAVDPSTLGLPKTKWAQSQTKKFINL